MPLTSETWKKMVKKGNDMTGHMPPRKVHRDNIHAEVAEREQKEAEQKAALEEAENAKKKAEVPVKPTKSSEK